MSPSSSPPLTKAPVSLHTEVHGAVPGPRASWEFGNPLLLQSSVRSPQASCTALSLSLSLSWTWSFGENQLSWPHKRGM